MRVGMLVDTFIPQIGGAELHVLELSRALRKMGVDISICTATPGPNLIDGFPVIRVPALTGGSGHRALTSFLTWPLLASFIRKVDILHCHYTYLMSCLGVCISQVFQKPSIVTLHGLGTLDSSVGKSLSRRFYRAVSFRFADKIIATSHEMRIVAERYIDSEKVSVIPNGVDTDFFNPDLEFARKPKDKIVILTMRRLAPKNGVQYLVEASPSIIKEMPQVEFWIAGTGKLESYLKQRVYELDVVNHFCFLGEVLHHQTRNFYASADIVVFPSSAESTSLACLEAMSMKKAIVASALSAYKEMLGNNGRGILVNLFDRDWSDYNAPLTIPQERIKHLADAIIDLVKNESTRKRLGENARGFVRKYFDWTIVAKKTYSIYTAYIRGDS